MKYVSTILTKNMKQSRENYIKNIPLKTTWLEKHPEHFKYFYKDIFSSNCDFCRTNLNNFVFLLLAVEEEEDSSENCTHYWFCNETCSNLFILKNL